MRGGRHDHEPGRYDHDRKHQIRGADIRCVVCGREPFADDTALECHELRRFGPDGEFSNSPAVGSWYCPAHFPPKQRIARTIRGTPLEAVAELERLFADESARVFEALLGDDDDNTDDVEAAFDGFRREIERGLGQLREVIARHVKPPAKMPPPRRSQRKALRKSERNAPAQISLIEEEPMTIRDTS
jgi:hypothetical protein